MKKILLITMLIQYANAGLTGDTPKERKIWQKRFTKIILGKSNKEIKKLKRKIRILEQKLSKNQIYYQIPLEDARRTKGYKKIKNELTITEDEEIERLKFDLEILKNLIRIHNINN